MYDATVVSLLGQAGAHVIGKTNCDEFGMGQGHFSVYESLLMQSAAL